MAAAKKPETTKLELNPDETTFLTLLLQNVQLPEALAKMLAASIQTKLEEAQGS